MLQARITHHIAKRQFATSVARYHATPRQVPDPGTRSFFRITRRLSAVLGTFLGLGLIWSYAPPFTTTTNEGRAFAQHIQKDWTAEEAREGDPGRKETEEQRNEEQQYRASHRGQPKGDFP